MDGDVPPPNPRPIDQRLSADQQRGLALVLGGLFLLLSLYAIREHWGAGRVTVDRLPEHRLDFKINLNQANRFELVQLPGIGPQLAEAIVEERSRVGRFRSVEDLDKVRGIGPAVLKQIRPYVFIDDQTKAEKVGEGLGHSP